MGAKESLIWISCIDKSRSILEINRVWSISSATLYTKNVASDMIRKNLLKVDNIESKNIFYKSKFEDWLYFTPDDDVKKSLKKDQNVYTNFLNKEYIRKNLFDIDAVKILSNHNIDIAKRFAFKYPTIILLQVLLYKRIQEFFKSELVHYNTDSFKYTINFLQTFLNTNRIVGIQNYTKYVISYDFLNHIEPDYKKLKNTEFFEKYINKPLNPFLPLMKKMVIK